MKLIIAIIQPTKLRAVKQALVHAGVERITICDSQEFAKHVEREPIYRGLEYRTNILRKITLEIAVNDDYLERTLEIIEHVAKTGSRGTDGDGKIFVLNLEEAIQISPEMRGPGAI
ncbi:MAG: P-II family nitrogen regulator [Planctomycetota bacterium]|nr:P-II family nitrogen regulator [Planctomycetota bacterium]